MSQKLQVSAEVAANAGLMWVAVLVARLVEKGVLSADEANEVAALAAMGCPGGKAGIGGQLIEAIQPSAVGVDPIRAARERGVTVQVGGESTAGV